MPESLGKPVQLLYSFREGIPPEFPININYRAATGYAFDSASPHMYTIIMAVVNF